MGEIACAVASPQPGFTSWKALADDRRGVGPQMGACGLQRLKKSIAYGHAERSKKAEKAAHVISPAKGRTWEE
jgi:hypothetical protein